MGEREPDRIASAPAPASAPVHSVKSSGDLPDGLVVGAPRRERAPKDQDNLSEERIELIGGPRGMGCRFLHRSLSTVSMNQRTLAGRNVTAHFARAPRQPDFNSGTHIRPR
jgi:hypothetical protein